MPYLRAGSSEGCDAVLAAAVDMTTPDDYLGKLSSDKRATLETVRRRIRAAAPQAEERMSYGMPAFVQGKPIAGYAAHSSHCSYHPMSGNITTELAGDLKGYQTTKGGIRFAIGEPLPAALVRKLVRARLAEIAGPSSAKKTARRKAAPKQGARKKTSKKKTAR
jgi:uncharacterized protein YdhG (YjbR/CyaY superfamily)